MLNALQTSPQVTPEIHDQQKPKVTLVRGPIVFSNGSVNNEATPAIAFAYLAGYAREQGYDVDFVDGIALGLNQTWPLEIRDGFSCQGLKFDDIISLIPEDTDVIGFSAMFSGEWPVLKELIQRTRKRFPEKLIIAGGEHISALTEHSLRSCPEINLCIRGEGELPFMAVLEAITKGQDYYNLDAISYIDKSGEYIHNGSVNPRMKNIDKLPWPYWPEGYLENFWKHGKSYGISSERDMPFMISRGCPYSCSFCSNKQMYTNRYVLRDIDDVIAEIKYYLKRYNITSIQLYDLTAITKRSWILELCQRLIKENIKLNWSLPSGTRSEALDLEVLNLLKQTGCNYLVYAPESGSVRSLKRIRKKVDLDKVVESVEAAKKVGLVLRTNLIIGFPGETWRDVFDTIMFGFKMAKKGVDDVPIFIFSPYPGTEFFDLIYKDSNLVLDDEYFYSLTSLNGNYFSTNIVSYTKNISSLSLGIIRVLAIFTNYILTYLFYPSRIIRFFRSLNSKTSATVFEHRLKDMLKRKKVEV